MINQAHQPLTPCRGSCTLHLQVSTDAVRAKLALLLSSAPAQHAAPSAQAPARSRAQTVLDALASAQLLPKVIQAIINALQTDAGSTPASSTGAATPSVQQTPAVAYAGLCALRDTACLISTAYGAAPTEQCPKLGLQQGIAELSQHVAQHSEQLMEPHRATSDVQWGSVLSVGAPGALPAHQACPTGLMAYIGLVQAAPLPEQERDRVLGGVLAAVYSAAQRSEPDTDSTHITLPSAPQLTAFQPQHAAHVLAVLRDAPRITASMAAALCRAAGLAPEGAAAVEQQAAAVLHMLELAAAALASYQHTRERVAAAEAHTTQDFGELIAQSSMPLVFKNVFDVDINDSTELVVHPALQQAADDSCSHSQQLSLLEAVAGRLLAVVTAWLAAEPAVLRSEHAAAVLRLGLACQAATDTSTDGSLANKAGELSKALASPNTYAGAVALEFGQQLLAECYCPPAAAAAQSSAAQQWLQRLAACIAVGLSARGATAAAGPALPVVVAWAHTLTPAAAAAGDSGMQLYSAVQLAPLLLTTAMSGQQTQAAVLTLCTQLLQQAKSSTPAADAADTAAAHSREQTASAVVRVLVAVSAVLGLQRGCPAWAVDACVEAATAAAGSSSAASQQGPLWSVLQCASDVPSSAELWQLCASQPVRDCAAAALRTAHGAAAGAPAKDTLAVNVAAARGLIVELCDAALRPTAEASQQPSAGSSTDAAAIRAAAVAATAVLADIGTGLPAAEPATQGFNNCDSVAWVVDVAHAFNAVVTASNRSVMSVDNVLTSGLPAGKDAAGLLAAAGAAGVQPAAGWLRQWLTQAKLQRYEQAGDFARRSFGLLSAAAEMLVHMVQGKVSVYKLRPSSDYRQ